MVWPREKNAQERLAGKILLLHQRKSGPDVDQGAGGVTTSSTLLGPTSVQHGDAVASPTLEIIHYSGKNFEHSSKLYSYIHI